MRDRTREEIARLVDPELVAKISEHQIDLVLHMSKKIDPVMGLIVVACLLEDLKEMRREQGGEESDRYIADLVSVIRERQKAAQEQMAGVMSYQGERPSA